MILSCRYLLASYDTYTTTTSTSTTSIDTYINSLLLTHLTLVLIDQMKRGTGNIFAKLDINMLPIDVRHGRSVTVDVTPLSIQHKPSIEGVHILSQYQVVCDEIRVLCQLLQISKPYHQSATGSMISNPYHWHPHPHVIHNGTTTTTTTSTSDQGVLIPPPHLLLHGGLYERLITATTTSQTPDHIEHNELSHLLEILNKGDVMTTATDYNEEWWLIGSALCNVLKESLITTYPLMKQAVYSVLRLEKMSVNSSAGPTTTATSATTTATSTTALKHPIPATTKLIHPTPAVTVPSVSVPVVMPITKPSIPIPTTLPIASTSTTSTTPVVLPIDAFRTEILTQIQTQSVTVIQGETGCGKSSRVPAMILDEWYRLKGEGKLPGQVQEQATTTTTTTAVSTSTSSTTTYRPHPLIIVTQPRRIAAIALAKRVASERQESLGHTVGYRIGQVRKR